jgi:hypothetical protein
MRVLLTCGFLLLLFLARVAGAAEPKTITFAVLDTCSKPFCDIRQQGERQELAGGIMKEWYEAIAAELGRQPRMLLLPRKRMEDPKVERLFDLDCFLAPQWVADPSRYDWLLTFLTIEDRLVSLPAMPPVHGLDDLAGKRIGIIHGYSYPLLDPLFTAGRAIREEAGNDDSEISKQVMGRADYSVINMIRFDYLRTVDPAVAKLAVSPLVVGRTPQVCRRPRYSTIALSDMLVAQQRLLARGMMQRILEHYRPEK